MKYVILFSVMFFKLTSASGQDGTLDATFGTGGIVTTSFGMYSMDDANDVTIQLDGKIVAVGSSLDPNTDLSNFSLARYNSNGSLDNNFGVGGKVMTSVVADFNCTAVAVDLQVDGRILVAGYANDTNTITTQNGYFVVVRYQTNGSLDSTFGVNGIARFQVAAILSPEVLLGDMLLQPDSLIVVGGSAYINMVDGDMVFMRIDAGGVLDTTFGIAGTSIQAPPSGGASPTAMALQQDGRMVVACLIDAGNHNDPMLTKLNIDGSIDQNFGSSGFVFPSYGFSSAFLGVAIQSDGNILACGFADTGAVIARFYDDGLVDATFGVGGSLVIPIGVQVDATFEDLIIQPDGKIVVSGMADAIFVLVRVTALGVLDATFGTGGIVQTQIGSSISDAAHSIVLQQDGKIVVAGYSISMNINSPQVYALARYTNSAVMSSSYHDLTVANIFPNPASEIVTMNWTAVIVAQTISIYSLAGDLLFVQHVEGETKTQIDVSGFSNGAYVIVVDDGASQFTTKLMVAH